MIQNTNDLWVYRLESHFFDTETHLLSKSHFFQRFVQLILKEAWFSSVSRGYAWCSSLWLWVYRVFKVSLHYSLVWSIISLFPDIWRNQTWSLSSHKRLEHFCYQNNLVCCATLSISFNQNIILYSHTGMTFFSVSMLVTFTQRLSKKLLWNFYFFCGKFCLF